MTVGRLAASIRKVTGAEAVPRMSKSSAELLATKTGALVLSSGAGIDLQGELSVPPGEGRHPAVLLLVPDSIRGDSSIARANLAQFNSLAAAGNVVLAITPRPSPPGTDDMKSPILGPFYLLSLRASWLGRTLLGVRVDAVFRARVFRGFRAAVAPS